ncbi:DedA family protein [Paenibacillus sambharensis]|uniref:DedA family protein n=1 Tax=Paenibacillus sambharensis TaxID=1803190 RepID=A0A2W1LT85_9BACL|nr:DedA family protein [Paenibacillus sambharensis]PZD94657.1 DedA family protein [Paenibacillus sambharensis]
MDWLSDLIGLLLQWIQSLGYLGILIGLAVEVIPSEIVLGYGGFLVSRQELTFMGAVVIGTLGAVLQQWILYGIGRFGGRPFLDRFGKYIKIKPKHMDIAEQWFQKYGAGIVFTARFVPVMRQVISIPAGITRMNLWLFTLLTLLASIPWTILFVYLGMKLGAEWETIHEKAAPYIQPAVLLGLGTLIVYFIWKQVEGRSRSL